MSNSNAKGGAFERRVCNNLSLWVSDFTRKDIFWRSAMSGGRATVHKKKGISLRSQVGDVCAIHPLGHFLTNKFMIECKHYKSLGWEPVLYGSEKLVAGFWIKVQQEAKTFKKAPMLIGKQNNKRDIVILNKFGTKFCMNNKMEPMFIVPRLEMYVYIFADLLAIPFEEIRNRNGKKRSRKRKKLHINR